MDSSGNDLDRIFLLAHVFIRPLVLGDLIAMGEEKSVQRWLCQERDPENEDKLHACHIEHEESLIEALGWGSRV